MPEMPKLRPWVCQKCAVLGPASFQDAIWKCFKCQKKCDTLSSVFISFYPVLLFPWYLLYSPRFLLEAVSPAHGLTSSQGRSCCVQNGCICCCLFLLPPLWLPELSFHYASVVHTQPFYCLLVWPWDWALPFLCASWAHGFTILFLGKDTHHSTSRDLLFCDHFYRSSIHMCSTNVYPWCLQAIQRPSGVLTLNVTRRGWKSSKYPFPAHLGEQLKVENSLAVDPLPHGIITRVTTQRYWLLVYLCVSIQDNCYGFR